MRTAIGALLACAWSIVGCGSDEGPTTPVSAAQPATYYDDVLPILERSCLPCHQTGGIAPIRLDAYASAKSSAAAMKAATRARAMPPWGATSDGSCGTFRDSLALTDAEIETISAWADAGAAEGKVRALQLPVPEELNSATDYPTPLFAPQIQGGQLAEFDEYRCFLLDSGVSEPSFITGTQVIPGTPEIVHHVLGFVVDPDAPASDGSGTNGVLMAKLDAESPDRDGWPCFGMAGNGVGVSSVPVTWAPGQGVVKYPEQSGVPLLPKHKLVIQVHYNLADSASIGKTDLTKVRLQLAASVERVGIFSLPDPFLRSLSSPQGSASLAPGQSSIKFTWTATVTDLKLGSIPGLTLYGVGPHMHERGHKYRLHVGDPEQAASCAADIQAWDFHWQRLYFYAEPRPVQPDTPITVVCDYDTTGDTVPVLPGWGTRNEMCLAVLYFTAPLAAASGS